jgi:SAM-dependent methyltransferase
MNSSDPGYWRQRYRLGDTPWDKGRAHPALERWLSNNSPQQGDRVFVPGCGSGYDVCLWASFGAKAVGMDIVPEAAELAKRLHSSSAAPGIEFCSGSIFDPPAHLLGTFDWVFEHTCFCAFDPSHRPLYSAAIPALLKPGGKFLAIFYMRPDHDESPPFGSDDEELFSLFGRDFEMLSKEIAEPTFPGREQREEIWLWQKKF